MAQIVVQNWLEEVAAYSLGLYNSGDMRIGLFQNNYTPLITSVYADFTAANFGGYSGPITLSAWTAGLWSSPRFDVTHPNAVWTADGSSTNTIYGYFVYDLPTLKLWWAERRAAGGVIVGAVAGQSYIVSPVQTWRSEF